MSSAKKAIDDTRTQTTVAAFGSTRYTQVYRCVVAPILFHKVCYTKALSNDVNLAGECAAYGPCREKLYQMQPFEFSCFVLSICCLWQINRV